MNRDTFLLYAVTDRSWVGEHSIYEQIVMALKGGVTLLQLREKDLSEKAFLEEARKVKALCDCYQVPLIINDNIRVAKAVGAAGVHLGQSDIDIQRARDFLGNEMMIGVSTRNVSQAKKAYEEGANYLGVGAIFGTSTKKDAHHTAITTLKEIVQSVPIPVVAIGGIDMKNISQLKDTGIAGPAIVSGIFGAKDIEGRTRDLKGICKELFL